MPDIPKLYETYAANTARYPILYEELANQLGVSSESVVAIGVGFLPVDEHDHSAWVFPERNAKGKVVGVSKRLMNGKKYMVEGSKRGLIYAVHTDTAQYEKRQWARVSTARPCPLCGKPDGCLYPEGEYDDPNAVVCVHIATGATRPMKLGYLHILDPARQKLLIQNYSFLLPSDHPILIVEGASDVCAAYDLGFTAIGKPSAASKSKDLVNLLAGRDVVVMGENDAGAGKTGMEATARLLQAKCPEVTKLMPPTGVKDLRQWKEKGLTQAGLLAHIEKAGVKVSCKPFKTDAARTIAREWLKGCWTDANGNSLLRTFHEMYAQFKDGCYELTNKKALRGSVHDFVENKLFYSDDTKAKPYKATTRKVDDIIIAAESLFPTDQPIPSWISGRHDKPNPARLLGFDNGLLDVDQYLSEGKIVLHNSDPDLFSFTKLPYAFDEDLESEVSESFMADSLDGDADQVLLLSEWFGHNLLPDRRFRKLMFLIGETTAGKTLLVNMLINMLGEKNCASTSYQSLSGDFGRQPLMGKLAAVIPDARDTNKCDMNNALGYMLMITGGDPTSANIKSVNELPLIYLPCRFTIGMNSLPMFQDDTLAFEVRLCVVRFDKSFVGREDFSLPDKLYKDAADGKLINWALRGLKSLHNRGRFIEPEKGKQVLKSFRELASPKICFLDRCVERDSDGPGISITELYRVWIWWAKRDGETYGKKSAFLHFVRSRLPYITECAGDETNGGERILKGIKLKAWVTKIIEKC